MKLLISAFSKLLIGLFLTMALLFIPAGSFGYINAWLFIGLLFIPMLILGTVLFLKSPGLLRKRLNAKETEATQKGVVAISGLLFFVGFIIAGLDYRYKWSNIPLWVVILASAILLVSYLLYAEVMRENTYLSRIIEVEENQTVIDSGLYRVVRHPMYAVTIWLFLSIPIVLGSLWSLVCFLPYIIVIVIRINNEEKVLEKELDGYIEYKKKVKYRLIPFVW